MAKLIEGIPGRNYEEDIDIWEDDAYLIADDDDPNVKDIDLLDDMADYSVDDSQNIAKVKILLKDGNTVVIGMSRRELKLYEKSAESTFKDRPITSEDIKAIQTNYTPAQSTAWKIFKVLLYIWAAAVIVGILIALFGK